MNRINHFAAILINGLALFILTGIVGAQETAVDYLEPRVTRKLYLDLTQPLSFSSDQRNITELAFSDYTATMTELTKQVDQQAVQAGRQSVQDALAGKARVAPEELQRLRVAVLRAYEQNWPAVDEALQTLLGTIESVLTPAQELVFQARVRQIRRDILLHPRQSESDYQEYAGDGVDMLLLVQSASQEGGELQGVPMDALQEVLAAYEQQLDALLIQSAPAYRQGKLQRKIATIEKDSAANHQLEQASLERWKQLYQLNQHTVELIANAAAPTLGDEGRQRWLDRFDQASFCWLYPRKRPDRQIEWMRTQNLDAGKMQQAESIYSTYVARRQALSRQAIALMLRGRLEFNTLLYAMMDARTIDDRNCRAMHEDLLKNSGELSTLESTTSSSLESLLTDAQRRSMRDAIKGPDPANRRK